MLLEDARDILRVDIGDNDVLISSLIKALPDYIEVVTGMKPEQQCLEPLVYTVEKFILTLWYFADKADDMSLNRTIDNLLKAITIKAKRSQSLTSGHSWQHGT